MEMLILILHNIVYWQHCKLWKVYILLEIPICKVKHVRYNKKNKSMAKSQHGLSQIFMIIRDGIVSNFSTRMTFIIMECINVIKPDWPMILRQHSHPSGLNDKAF